MIKTVSFAPPRSSSPRGASRSSAGRASGSSTHPANAASASLPLQTSLFDDTPVEPVIQAIPAAKLRAKTRSQAPKLEVAKTPVEAPVLEVKVAPEVKTAPIAAPPAPKKLKAKRAKVPENLAAEYGAKVSKRVELGQTEIPEAEAPKKRLTKAEREARKQLMRPDEDLLQRLKRATALAPAPKTAKPKGWRFDCGRCGRTLYFQTLGALCDCGAIAVKE